MRGRAIILIFSSRVNSVSVQPGLGVVMSLTRSGA